MNTRAAHHFPIDIVRLVGILGVLFIHLLYPVYSRPDFLGGKSWWIANILHSFALVSVPLFILVSGYLLLDKTYSLHTIFTKALNRLLIPLLFWYGFYLWWNTTFNHATPTVWGVLGALGSGSMHHLYYLVILLGLYVHLPWISHLVKTVSSNEKRYLFILAWIVGVGMYAINYLDIVGGPVMNTFTWWMPFVGYFLTGYLIRRRGVKKDVDKGMIWVFGVWWLFTIIMGFEGVEMMKWNFTFFWHHSGLYFFNTFLSPNVILMAVSLFWWLTKGIEWESFIRYSPLRRILQELSRATFGVYLVHFAVMDWIDLRYGYAIEFVGNNLRAFLIERTLLVVFISFAIALAIRKIPFIKRLVGE